jgi:hypothetical protein
MVDGEGIVATTLNASWEGALSAGRDMIVATQTRAADDFEFDVLVRKTPPYEVGALRGRYAVTVVAAGPEDGRAFGKALVGDSGNFHVGLLSSLSTVVVDSGVLLYDGDGLLTRPDAPLWEAAASASRDVIVGSRGVTGAVDFFCDVREPPEALRVTGIERSSPCGSDSLKITWTSFPGESYDLLTSTDPDPPPDGWAVFLHDVPAELTVGPALEGRTTREFAAPDDRERYYNVVVREPER